MLRKKYVIGGILILAAVSFLLYTGFREGTVYYYTVSELKENAAALMDKEIRVTGQVADGSMEWEPDSLTVRFTLLDENESLPITYRGIAPDNLQEGRDVVVGGKYREDGIFLADNILTKCPSKYEPQE
jgi:cytochrome c-type biogenesis protein CcmE